MHYLQEEIGLPKITTQKSGSTTATGGTIATFVVTPLPAGYGTTLGNALRRVLLSSLPGAAVTGVKFTGVNYEYATLKGVRDSVLDIILNLKLLALRKTSKEPSMLTLKVTKEGIVTAKDIQPTSDVEILNPDRYLT
ncbi:MAG: DNA-directed RNA polymerase subunit alpha, partial [Patescibacteria group bacterium]